MNSESKHTPGPWKLARSNPGMTTGLIGPTRDKRLGTIHTGCAEYVANAHLIAAAPDMLDALIMANRWLAIAHGQTAVREKIRGVEEEWTIDLTPGIEAVEAAISRAEGKAS